MNLRDVVKDEAPHGKPPGTVCGHTCPASASGPTRSVVEPWVTSALESGMVAVDGVKMTGAPIPLGGV